MESWFAERELAKSGPRGEGLFGGHGFNVKVKPFTSADYAELVDLRSRAGQNQLEAKTPAQLEARRLQGEAKRKMVAREGGGAYAAAAAAPEPAPSAGSAPAKKRKREKQRRPEVGSVVRLRPGLKGDNARGGQGSLHPGDEGTVVRDIWKERGVPEYIVKTHRGSSLYHEDQLVCVSLSGGGAAAAAGSSGDEAAYDEAMRRRPGRCPDNQTGRRSGAWVECWTDPRKKDRFWYNEQTGEKSWDPPPAQPVAAEPSTGALAAIERRAAKLQKRTERLDEKRRAAAAAAGGAAPSGGGAPAGDSDNDVEA